jgi:DNA-binding NarL/FixJ family response regulator
MGWNILIAETDPRRSTRWMNDLAKRPEVDMVRCVDRLDDLAFGESEFPYEACLVNFTAFTIDRLEVEINQIRREHPNCRVLVFQLPADSPEALRLFEAGAWSCLPGPLTCRRALTWVEAAGRGECYLPADAAGKVIRRLRQLSLARPQRETLSGPAQVLTNREREILAFLGQRKSNLEIARELILEVGTVKNHVHSVLKKLEVGSRHRAAEIAVQAGVDVGL